MFPTTRANTTVVSTILSTLNRGAGTSSPSDGTTGNVSTLPFYPDMPQDLVNRVITTVLTGSTTISTAGLATDSVNILANIRTRVDDAINTIYADTPNISPYYYANGTIKSSTLREGRRDLIIQQLFNYDARYFLRKRASTALGGVNEYYEFPTRHNYMNTPYLEAQLRAHTIGSGTVDDTGVGGAYRVVCSDKHGIYDITESGNGVMSFWRAGYSGTSILNKQYFVDDLYQEISLTLDGTDTNSKFRFNANIGTNWLIDGNTSVTSNIGYAVGSQILTTDLLSTTWQAMAYQPTRYFKLVDSGTAVKFYHDTALTDQLVPGYGYIGRAEYRSYQGGIEVFATNSTGGQDRTHLMFQDLPQIFDQPAGWTGNVGFLDRSTVVDYYSRPSAGSFFDLNKQLSIYDGQPMNLVCSTTGFSTLSNDPTMIYSKSIGGFDYQAYTDAALTTIYNIGEEVGTLSNIAYVSGNVRLTFNVAFPGLADSVGVYILGSGTDFSDLYNVNSRAANNVCTLDSVHVLENGQPVYRVQAPDTVYYAETAGFATNQVRFHTGISWSGGVPTFSGNTAMPVNDDIRPAWYTGRVSNTVWQLYNDQGLTVPYTTVISTASFTTCDSKPIAFQLTFPAGSYIQPMFYTKMEEYTSAYLYRDVALTQPYAYVWANAIPGTTINTIGTTQGGAAATYRVNNQAMNLGFTSNVRAQNFHVAQAYWPKVINDTTVDLYADPARTAPVKAPAISPAQSTTGLNATYLFNGRYRLDFFNQYNPGGSTYFYDNTGDGVKDTVGAGWNTTGQYFYTPHYTYQTIVRAPNIGVELYSASNALAYYGHLRPVTSNVSLVSATGPAYKDPADYAGLDTGPLYYPKNDPGMFLYGGADVGLATDVGQPFAVGVERFPDITVTVTGADDLALANTAPEWDSINNLVDRDLREWPSTTNPTSVTWTIEQPNQTLESRNATRFVRASDVTQYRIRYIYPPMTREDIKPYIDVIHAARGSYKPFKLHVPVATGGDERTSDSALTIRYFDRSSGAVTPIVLRVRESADGGTKLLKVDGAPINYNKTVGNVSLGTSYVFGTGHALGSRDEYDDNAADFNSSLGAWLLPIHEVESNSYGEINIRLNNGVPGDFDLGTRIFRDAAYLNVFLDGNTVELKVDVLGYHYLEVEFITKKIF